ncbi:DUF4342 domain-containing protein [candidate division WOR-3 bacterium]|nr:DUF4342 domain-containing protein [candidate division WOR-3 bacterium]
MEENSNQEKFEVRGEDLIKKINEILKEGNAKRIIIQNEKGETVAEFPLSVGVVGVFLSPMLAAAGAIAALATKCTIIVDRKKTPIKED